MHSYGSPEVPQTPRSYNTILIEAFKFIWDVQKPLSITIKSRFRSVNLFVKVSRVCAVTFSNKVGTCLFSLMSSADLDKNIYLKKVGINAPMSPSVSPGLIRRSDSFQNLVVWGQAYVVGVISPPPIICPHMFHRAWFHRNVSAFDFFSQFIDGKENLLNVKLNETKNFLVCDNWFDPLISI